MASSASIRAIFFDFDGVLVDSEPVHYQCWAEVLAGYAMPLEWDFYRQNFIGSSDRDMIEVLCKRFGRNYDAGFFRQCYEQKQRLYQQSAPGRLVVSEELVSFILTSFKTYGLAVVSSSSRCEVEPHLVGQGIRHAITALVCREDVERSKPDPEPYRRALDIVNRQANGRHIAPAECLVIEDSIPGVEAGQRAGMRVLRVRGPASVLERLQTELGQG